MDWQNTLIFLIIPVFTVSIVFFIKKKLLWLSPLISTILAFVAYMMNFRLGGMQSPIIKIFSNNEWRSFLLLALLIHFVITVIVTMIAYLVAHILKRKQSKDSNVN